MKSSDKIRIPLCNLVGLENNPRTITKQDLNRLCDSIRKNGYWEHRPLGVERVDGQDKFRVLDGNQRLKAIRLLKKKEVPCVIYEDLTQEEREELILRSNINNGAWDMDTLASDFMQTDFEAIGLDFVPPEVPMEEVKNDVTPEEIADAEEKIDKLSFYLRMLGDYIYPSNNEFEIPTLLDDNQPVHLELPFTAWGVESRYRKDITTYHFYVDDYRFEALFKDPIKLLMSGCRAVVEPNCSIHDQTPTAYALYQIYKKRYLARYLQECGLQVWVDLNVSHRFMDYNLLGVPKGYNAFFTRGVAGWEPHLEMCLEKAKQVSGLEKPNMYVYGGGKKIAEWCREKGLCYLDEYMNGKKS